jgi:hypothetical protein
MNLHATMLGKNLLDQFRLVAAHVVADDVYLTPRRLRGDDLLQERDELFAGVARSSLARHHRAGRGAAATQAARRQSWSFPER